MRPTATSEERAGDPPGAAAHADRRGWWGIAALVLLALAGIIVAAAVIALETHFDCGGTFGGPGASATADLDDDCVDGRRWKMPVAGVVIVGSTVLAGLAVHRTGRTWTRRLNGWARTGAVVILLLVVWAVGITVFVRY